MKNVKPATEQKLNMAWQIFKSSGIKTEILAGFEGTNTGYTGNASEDILTITAVHPLREETLNELLKKENADRSIIESLISKGLIKKVSYKGKEYYMRSYT
jgi:hypothetical protein